ncbi:hypothetical protein Gotur_013372, partial [Gossypium turneri]
MLRYQWEDVVIFWNSKKGEDKLKDKRAEYEAMASSDSFVNLDDIDNQIITEVLGPESTVEQIAQLKVEAALREAKAQRKYDELQVQLKAEAAAREVEAAARVAEATRKYDELQLQFQNMMTMF